MWFKKQTKIILSIQTLNQFSYTDMKPVKHISSRYLSACELFWESSGQIMSQIFGSQEIERQ